MAELKPCPACGGPCVFDCNHMGEPAEVRCCQCPYTLTAGTETVSAVVEMHNALPREERWVPELMHGLAEFIGRLDDEDNANATDYGSELYALLTKHGIDPVRFARNTPPRGPEVTDD